MKKEKLVDDRVNRHSRMVQKVVICTVGLPSHNLSDGEQGLLLLNLETKKKGYPPHFPHTKTFHVNGSFST